MVELGGTAGFAQEAILFFLFANAARTRNLDGNRSIQLRIARLVNCAEGAGSELPEDFEFAKPARPFQPRRGAGPFQLNTRATGRADHTGRLPFRKVDGVVAVRARYRHGLIAVRGERIAPDDCSPRQHKCPGSGQPKPPAYSIAR